MKTNHILLVVLCCMFLNAQAQERNFSTTLGLGYGYTIPFGQVKSNDIYDFNSGFALESPVGFKFFIEQNLGKYVGVSFSFYSIYHDLDLYSYQESLVLDNRNLVQDPGLYYEVLDNDSWWEMDISNIGVYYHRMFGENQNLELKFIGAISIVSMQSPSFNVNIHDSSGSIVEQKTIESSQSWKESSFAPPINGFSLEINAQYFFYKHFSVEPSIYFTKSIGWFNGSDKALINLSRMDYIGLNLSLGLCYTLFYNRKRKQ